MARIEDLHEAGRKNIEALECPSFEDKPFTTAPVAGERRMALISTAGLIERGDRPFRGGDAGFREITANTANKDILISHVSVNFDRSAAIRNIESIFPRQTCRALVEQGVIAEVADNHFSFMGASDPLTMEPEIPKLAARLTEAGVNTVVLLPV